MREVKEILPAARARLVTVRAEALLVEAARKLKGPECNLVVVCDDAGRMIGIVTKTDVVRQISHCTGASCTAAASRVMTRDVTLCRPEDRLEDVWSAFKQRGLKNIPVVDQSGIALGVVSARDTLEKLLEDVQYDERLLRDYVSSVGYR